MVWSVIHVYLNISSICCQVLLGQEDLSLDPEEAGGQERRVTRVTVHPDYARAAHTRLTSDLAILELESPVTADTRIVPVCLPEDIILEARSSLSRDPEDVSGNIGVISGWGRLRSDGPISPQLQSAEVKYE